MSHAESPRYRMSDVRPALSEEPIGVTVGRRSATHLTSSFGPRGRGEPEPLPRMRGAGWHRSARVAPLTCAGSLISLRSPIFCHFLDFVLLTLSLMAVSKFRTLASAVQTRSRVRAARARHLVGSRSARHLAVTAPSSCPPAASMRLTSRSTRTLCLVAAVKRHHRRQEIPERQQHLKRG